MNSFDIGVFVCVKKGINLSTCLCCAGEAGADPGDDPLPGAGGAPKAPGGDAPTPETAAGDLRAEPGEFSGTDALILGANPRPRNTLCFHRDRKKADTARRRSKTPPKSYSTARRSRSASRYCILYCIL